MKRFIILLAAAMLTVSAMAMPVSAAEPTTTGTWYSYPPQTYTDETITTTGSTYKSAVRSPINADGTSNWPAKRGVIPVQFDLLAAPSTTTTTTRTYDPPVWESLLGVPDSVSYAGLVLNPDLRLDEIALSAVYLFTEGDCKSGSLRWTLLVNVSGVDQILHVYYGTPNGPDQGCSGLNSGSGQDLMTTGITPNRFEMQGGWAAVAGPVYTTWEDVLASTHDGADLVSVAQLTLDSGFAGDQRANVSDVTVNDNTWVPKTVENLGSTTVAGDFAKTCDLPAAELRWAKNDATPTGGINEGESIQPKDTGQFYRNVDCKYIYNLAVSSLSGVGTYTVWVRIDGVNIAVPATFDLR